MSAHPTERSERKTTCDRDCPDTCSIVATVEGDGSGERVVALRGDPTHPVTRGAPCYRTNHFLPTQYSSTRLSAPLLRKHGELVPVSWDEALDFVAAGLERVKREFGPAIVYYRSGGSLGLLKHLSDYFFSLYGPVTVKRGHDRSRF